MPYGILTDLHPLRRNAKNKVWYNLYSQDFFLNESQITIEDVKAIAKIKLIPDKTATYYFTAGAAQVINELFSTDLKGYCDCLGCGHKYDGLTCWLCAEGKNERELFDMAMREDSIMKEAIKPSGDIERDLFDLSPNDPLPSERAKRDYFERYQGKSNL